MIPRALGADSSQGSENTGSVWQQLKRGPLRVALLGSGNWGTTISKVLGENVNKSFIFQKEVRMYCFEEPWQGRKLTEVINQTHENPKYLPGIKLPANVVAVPSITEAAAGADILVFTMPHQFLGDACKELKGHIRPGTKAISLIKGFQIEDDEISLASDYIGKVLGVECCVLSGANVARDVALEQFAEATIGYSSEESARLFQQLFDTPYFRVNCVKDVIGVQICGALKNVVALAAGFCDGLKLGTNTKAAIIRIGLAEMRSFTQAFAHHVVEETFWDSCGVADLITTCFGGRNRQCAEEFARTKENWDSLEKRLLGGQKLQGTLTAKDVYHFLSARNMCELFPLMTAVYKIAFEDLSPINVVNIFMSDTPRPIKSHSSPLPALPSKL